MTSCTLLTCPLLFNLRTFTSEKTKEDWILRSPRRGTRTAPRFAKPRGTGLSMGRGRAGGFPPPFAEPLLVSPKKREIPAGAFANRVAIPAPNPSASWFAIYIAIPSRPGWWEPWMIIPGAGGLETRLNQEKRLTRAPSFSTIKMTSQCAFGGRP